MSLIGRIKHTIARLQYVWATALALVAANLFGDVKIGHNDHTVGPFHAPSMRTRPFDCSVHTLLTQWVDLMCAKKWTINSTIKLTTIF